MEKRDMPYVLMIIGMLCTYNEARSSEFTISGSYCDRSYSLNSGDSVKLIYKGASIDNCKITITLNDITDTLCSSPDKFELSSCKTSIEYHDGTFLSYVPDETYSCSNTQWNDYCTTFSKMTIVFKNSGLGSNSDRVELKIHTKGNDIVDAVVTSVYVIVGVIVGIVVLVIIITIVVICVCCRRRQNQAGTVYRGAQPATVTTTTTGYPMQNQPGYQPVQPVYQPVQAGYQPPQAGYQPQPGYQPPPQPGYQPPAQQAGYPPAPQQGYAGYQTSPQPEPYPEKASAPPMQPPPYPGN